MKRKGVNKTNKAPPKEKRAKRYRTSCPQSLEERVLRASTQRLYLIRREFDDNESSNENNSSCRFDLLGSTGNVYQVTLQRVPYCTCPDYQKKQDLCKHILFVLLKVVGLDISNPLAFQKAYLSQELQQIFGILRSRRVGGTSIQANAQVLSNYAKMTGEYADKNDEEQEDVGIKRRSLEEDGDCPICFDSMTRNNKSTELTFCRAMCGANFHADCIRRWRQQHGRNSSTTTCPNCRQPWVDSSATLASSENVNEEGYVNLGHLQGQSPVRDTSTYYESPRRPRRR